MESIYEKVGEAVKTKRDFYRELEERYGITTSAMFHANLDEPISDEDYERKLEIMGSVNDLFDDEDVKYKSSGNWGNCRSFGDDIKNEILQSK